MSEAALYAYREAFVCWAGDRTEDYPFDHECPAGRDCDWGWVCNHDGCLTRTDEYPCPTHAPLAVPGLRLVECQAQPPHVLLAVDREDYGHGCPWCWSNEYRDELWALMEATHRYRHGVWRRWKATRRVLRLLHRAGIVRGWSYSHGDGCHGCISGLAWRRSKR